ncbi:MAG: hypothetical protein LBQ93_03775 [Treponema sp.]|jgi:hypothetical protein|nr:hypothetical protein [Treponema sp.]
MTGTPVIQLANTQNITAIFTAYQSPIWRAKLWVNPYEKHLPFMADQDTSYNKFAVELENIVIDFIEYLRVHDYNALRSTKSSWMTDPDDNSRLLIHFENHNPPLSFLSFKSGLLLGFSYGKPVRLGNLKTYPLILDIPAVEDTSDNLTYKRMEFSTGSVTIDNSAGILDEISELFGNDITLLSYTADKQLEVIRQYFIEKYTVGMDKVQFSVKDKRSRMTFKAPDSVYTKEEFPHIEENLINKPIQDAYGYCRGVAGTCLNRFQVYGPPSYDSSSPFNDWFQFKFARKITKIEKVYVEMSDEWIEVFPGLGIERNEKGDEITNYQPINLHPIRIMTKDPQGNYTVPVEVDGSNKDSLGDLDNNGVIEIWWNQALKDNPGYLERRNGNANKVKMTGVFVDLHTPGDIVKDMLIYYGKILFPASYFDLQEWEKEMAGGKQIGICLDKADDAYSWVEKIQNGAVLGFQLLVCRNLFSARVDNPNREETFDIRWMEIRNRNEIEPELNGDEYATFTTINYNKDYTDDEYITVIDKSQRLAILDTYKFEKEYANDSYLINEEDVRRKCRIVLENFMETRPVFRNIELDGLRWDEMQLFSTGWIDLSVELPRQMKIIQKYMKRRNIAGKLRVKVIGCRRDIKLEKTWIDVIQCDKLEALNEN